MTTAEPLYAVAGTVHVRVRIDGPDAFILDQITPAYDGVLSLDEAGGMLVVYELSDGKNKCRAIYSVGAWISAEVL